jgi:hypothetical protein
MDYSRSLEKEKSQFLTFNDLAHSFIVVSIMLCFDRKHSYYSFKSISEGQTCGPAAEDNMRHFSSPFKIWPWKYVYAVVQ